MDVYEYYKGLIAFRKAHSALRMTTAAAIQNNLTFMTGLDANVVAYTIQGEVQGETAQNIAVIYNGNPDAVTVTYLPGHGISVSMVKRQDADLLERRKVLLLSKVSLRWFWYREMIP
mgnify:CR=1 FL=1